MCVHAYHVSSFRAFFPSIMPRFELEDPRWSPYAIVEAMVRDVRKLIRMFKNYWGPTGEQVRRNCLAHALHRMTPNCFTTRDVVVGAALTSRADHLGGRRGLDVTKDS